MDFEEGRKIILRETAAALNGIGEKETAAFLELLLKSRRIFVAGEGRSRLMLMAFAKRLRHLGMESYVVGETVTPAGGPGDLLVAASGSGKTGNVLNAAALAGKHGMTVAFITASPTASLRQLSDLLVTLPACAMQAPREQAALPPRGAPASADKPAGVPSRQLMASLFEQTLLLFCDAASLALRDRLKVSEAQMRKAHANLE